MNLHRDRDQPGSARRNLTSGALAPGGRVKEERRHEHSLRRPPAAIQSPRPNRAAFAPTGGGHQGRATAGENRDERRRAGPGRGPLGVGHVRADQARTAAVGRAPASSEVGRGVARAKTERRRSRRSRKAECSPERLRGGPPGRMHGRTPRALPGQQMFPELPEHFPEHARLHPLPKHLHGCRVVAGIDLATMQPLDLRLP
jgi:hypothetical protein